MLPRKYRVHAALILICLVIIFLPRYMEKPDKEKAQLAKAATARFLQLLDADKYAESWQTSASLLKDKVAEDKWVELLKKNRSLLGPLVKRQQKEISYSTTATDSPEGEYILIIYDSTFQRKPGASEIVTVMLDKDKSWRVAGYFIK